MAMIWAIMLAVLAAPPTTEEWKAIKPLPKLTIPWGAPKERYRVDDAEMIQLTRILGAVTVDAGYTTKDQALAALTIAKLAETERGSPIKLGVLFRPWDAAVAPDSPEASAEFYATYRNWRKVQAALDASTYRPGVVCLVDSETFDARNEPNRSQVADLYSAYDAFIRAVCKCERVEWYGWGPWPGPCEPDSWCTQKWAVPFDGLQSIGWEAYLRGEIIGMREASRRARALADSVGIAETAAWVLAPGAGQVFTFDTTYQHIVWEAEPFTFYTAEVARELYGKWHCGKPGRFMACPSTVAVYPHPFDPRIADPDRRHLMAFLKAGTE